MSAARQCDRCGELFKPQIGVVTLDVGVDIDSKGTSSSWSDVEFCPPCSRDVLGVIGDAIDNLAGVIADARKAAAIRDPVKRDA